MKTSKPSIFLTVSYLFLALSCSVAAIAAPDYKMTVVKTAWVGEARKTHVPAMSCVPSKENALAVNRPGFKNDSAPQLVLNLGNGSSVVATRNMDDGYLNSVVLWLAVKSPSKVIYYPLTQRIDTLGNHLPEVTFEKSILSIKADTLTHEEGAEEILQNEPTKYGQIYQTIKIESVTANAASLTILSCSR